MSKKHPRMPHELRKGFRRMVIDSNDYSTSWQFKIGRQYVVIFSPDGIRYNPSHSELLGISWDEIERAHYKNRGSDHHANVHPQSIKD